MCVCLPAVAADLKRMHACFAAAFATWPALVFMLVGQEHNFGVNPGQCNRQRLGDRSTCFAVLLLPIVTACIACLNAFGRALCFGGVVSTWHPHVAFSSR
jgi:hypothetical protein